MIKTSCRIMAYLTLFIAGSIVSRYSYALPFTITPTTGVSLPTQIISGQTDTALYTVTNNTGSVRTGNYVKYLPPNVTQVTVDPIYTDLCGTTFTLNPRGASGSSCTLELKISGNVRANDPDPHHHLFVCFPGGITCAGTPNPLNVSSVNTAFTTALVANMGSNTMLRCSVNSITGKLTGCQDSGVGAVFDSPAALDPNFTNTRGYITNFGNGAGTIVSLCNLNPNTAQLSGCVNADGDGSAVFNGPLGISFDPSGEHIYVPNINSNIVTLCHIDIGTGKLIDCASTGSGFSAPIGITFNTADQRAYVSNTSAGTISLCSVNPEGGLFGCTNADGDGSAAFNGPALMSLNAAGTRLYVSNNSFGAGTSLSLCSINLITGKLFECADSGVGPIFNAPVSQTLSASNALIYVSNNQGTTVSLCTINSSTGKLTSCSNSDGDGSAVFSSPAGVHLQ